MQTEKVVKNYINDTLNGLGKKNIYGNRTMLNNTYDYCVSLNHKMTNVFISKHQEINKQH